jgi:hypothetical protein
LITAAAGRIHRLAATILHGSFKPLRMQGVCLTDDVSQEALLRVWKPLADTRLNDVNHLFQLASVCIRSHLVVVLAAWIIDTGVWNVLAVFGEDERACLEDENA